MAMLAIWNLAIWNVFIPLVQRWNNIMSDKDNKELDKLDRFDREEEEMRRSGLRVNVDGGFSISKQAVWRTIVIISTLVTGGGVAATKVENSKLMQELTTIRFEMLENKQATTKELEVFKSVMYDVVNFLTEEKAIQKTKEGKEKYQKEIDKVRSKLKPISKRNRGKELYTYPVGRETDVIDLSREYSRGGE